jgi:CBS domain-containing protein
MNVRALHIMKKPVTSVDAGMKLTEFARLLSEEEISGAPVVDGSGRLIGIVSRTDLVDHLLEGSQTRPIAPGFLSFLGLEGEMGGMAAGAEEEVWGTVGDIMSTDVITVVPDSPLAEVALKMSENRIHRVVVTEGGMPVGIITSLDLLGRFPRPVPVPIEEEVQEPGPGRKRAPARKKQGKPALEARPKKKRS